MTDPSVVLRDEDGREHVVTRTGERVKIGSRELEVRDLGGGLVRIGSNPAVTAWVAAAGETRWVFIAGRTYVLSAPNAARPAARRRRGGVHHGSLAAPMPATVRRVQVRAGDTVKRGDVLVILEAMKMELPVRATADGRVEAVNCAEGDMVQAGQELIAVEEADGGDRQP